LELRRVSPKHPRFVDFGPDKNVLFQWMQEHSRFAFAEIPNPKTAIETQFQLIADLRPLLNLHRRNDPVHPFEQPYRSLRDEMKARAAELIPMELSRACVSLPLRA
jgi:hypothetical protein